MLYFDVFLKVLFIEIWNSLRNDSNTSRKYGEKVSISWIWLEHEDGLALTIFEAL